MFNIQGRGRRLEVSDLKFEAPDAVVDLKGQMDAKYKNADYSNPLYGSFTVYDDNNNVVDKIKNKLIMRVPRPTGRGTYILDGQEYYIRYQLRLKPGVYTTKVEDGVQSFINTSTRQNIKLKFDPDTSVFSMHVANRKFPLYSILSALGVEEATMNKSWGPAILDANRTTEAQTEHAVDSLFQTMHAFDKGVRTKVEKISMLQDALKETEIDEWTLNVTLGEKASFLTPKLLFKASNKMLGVSDGSVKPDRRDALYFKRPMGIDDMVLFALEKRRGAIERKVKDRLQDPSKGLQSILSRPLVTLGSTVRGKFIIDELAGIPEQVNPLEMVSNTSEMTVMGEGGIPSTHAVTDEARWVDDTFLNFLDPLHSPSGPKVGVNMHMAFGTNKVGDKLLADFIDIGSGKLLKQSPEDVYDKYVALPGEMIVEGKSIRSKKPVVSALYKGEIIEVPASKINLAIEHEYLTMDQVSNMLPYLDHTAGIRSSYADKQITHALPLKYREAPLVRHLLSRDRSGKPTTADDILYNRMNIRVPAHIPKGSIVKQVRQNSVVIEAPDGEKFKVEYYRDFPLNSHVSLNATPIVKAGDKVTPGDILAENNFSAGGTAALGINLRTAYVPYKGLNFMDGLVITESAAKKLTSEHLYNENHSKYRDDTFSKKQFLAHYPTLYTKDQVDNLDDEGVILEGTKIMPGDPFLVKMTKRKITEDDILRGNVSSVFKNPMTKDTKTWEHESPGVVHKVVKGNNFIKVYIKTEEPAKLGDKLSQRAGAKGVISSIIPDSEAPKDGRGRPIELLQNPAAVPSRMNLGQIFETAAANIAHKTGKPYLAPNMVSDPNTVSNMQAELKKNGLNPESTTVLYDGTTGEEIGPVFTGPQYFVKMKQQAEKGFKARGRTDPYELASHRPYKGPKLDTLGLYAMLAHGSGNLLKEMGTFKSEMNDDYWRALETGRTLPAPQKTFAFNQLINMLKSSGINVREEGDGYRLAPLTDADVDNLSAGAVPDPGKAVRIGQPGSHEFLAPQKGGLYDQKIFGGLKGDRFGHIPLHDRYPNPIFEDAIRSVLNIKNVEFRALVEGDKGVKDGKIVSAGPGVLLGGSALESLLGGIDRDSTIKTLRDSIPTLRSAGKNDAIKKLKYLEGLRRLDMKPTDYLLSKIPVLPPSFRPVYMTRTGDMRVSDMTRIYQILGKSNGAMEDIKGIPHSLYKSLRKDVYDSMKYLSGLEDMQMYSGRRAFGMLKYLKGDEPPKGYFQSKMLGKRQAIGGQAVIMVDPKLDIDNVSIPDDMAWTIMHSMVMRRLVKQGIPPLRARSMVEDRHPHAERALDAELDYRPVILSRDPKLHKFSYMAFYANRHPGKAIFLPPLVVRGFNADFDGDKMGVNVPVSEEAVKEAKTLMMPSQNLFKFGSDSVIMYPEEDSVAGLYKGSIITKNRTGERYDTPSDILKAYDSGNIKLRDGVSLDGVWTSAARVLINQVLPEDLRDYSKEWDNTEIKVALNDIAKKYPKRYVPVVQGIKNLGDMFGYKTALSFKLSDFQPVKDRSAIESLHGTKEPPAGYDKIQGKINTLLKQKVNKKNTLALFADSGAKGNWGNVKQMLYTPSYYSDSNNKTYPHFVEGNYSSGMSFKDFWYAAKGGRTGEMSKSLETADPGYFGKQLMRSTLGTVVQPGDVNHGDGWEYSVSHPTVMYRYLAKDAIDSKGNVLAEANTPVTPELVQAAQKSGIKQFSVRSPLTSDAPMGIYAKDFGRLPTGNKPHTGTDLGVLSAHTLSEPAVQIVLKSFHGGGAAGTTQGIGGLYAIWPLLLGRTPAGQKAIMAYTGGTITDITKLKSGAYEVKINDKNKYITTPGLKLLVNKGDSVSRGDRLQEGFLNPKELLEYRGLKPLQNYLLEQLESAYGKNAPDRRYLETVVAGLTRYANIENPGDAKEYSFGDTATLNKIKDINRTLGEQGLKPIEYKPVFHGMDQLLPRAEEDWMVQMIGSDMIRQLRQSAAVDAKSYIHSTKPIMPFMHGINFADNIGVDGTY